LLHRAAPSRLPKIGRKARISNQVVHVTSPYPSQNRLLRGTRRALKEQSEG
jgi:hypothetical protein